MSLSAHIVIAFSPCAGVRQVMEKLLALAEPVDPLLFPSNQIALNGVIHPNETKKVPEELAVNTFDELISWDCFMYR